MRATRAIVRNVVRASFRNRTALFFTIGLAFFFMVIFGLLFGGHGPSLRIGVVDGDHSVLSQRFAGTLEATDGLDVETGSVADEQQRMRDDKIAYLLVINRGFGAASAGGSATLTAFANGDQLQQATIAANVVSSISSGFARANHLGGTPGIVISESKLGTNDITAIDAVLPSMIAYIVLQSGINFVAIGLVDQRQRKVLRRFLATPVRPMQILGANIVGGGLTVLIQVVVLVGAGLLLFHAKTHGSWPLASLVILVGTAAFVSIGFLLCSVARTSESARGLAAMIAFPMMFLSGVFIPLDALPQVMQNIVHALPLTYLTEALRGILNDGDGLTRTVAIDVGVLAIWAVACFTFAAMRFRWE